MISRIFFFIATIYFTQTLNSQAIPNAGFENWHNVGGWFDNPDNWMTNNNSILAPGVVRDSNAYQGNWGMKVSNVTNLPGLSYTSFSSTQHPYALKVFAKSNINTGDSASIIIRLYYAGVKVDSGTFYNTASIPNWSLITIPVSQTTQNIDSVEIVVKAGVQIGSWLSLDEFNVDLMGVNSVENQVSWFLFPNPIDESGLLSFENPNHENFTLSVYNPAGECVLKMTGITGSNVKIKKGNFARGVYLFELTGDKKAVLRGKVLME